MRKLNHDTDFRGFERKNMMLSARVTESEMDDISFVMKKMDVQSFSDYVVSTHNFFKKFSGQFPSSKTQAR